MKKPRFEDFDFSRLEELPPQKFVIGLAENPRLRDEGFVRGNAQYEANRKRETYVVLKNPNRGDYQFMRLSRWEEQDERTRSFLEVVPPLVEPHS